MVTIEDVFEMAREMYPDDENAQENFCAGAFIALDMFRITDEDIQRIING